MASKTPFFSNIGNNWRYVAQENYAAAALDFACVIPGVGFIKAGVKAERLAKLGEAAVKALKVEKALNKVAKAVEVTGEVLGKGKTLALKVVEKIPKIRVEVGGFRYFAVKVGEKEGGKVAKESGKGRYGERQISDEEYKSLREDTPTQELRDKVNEGHDKTAVTNDEALPGKKFTGALEADHIVPMDKMDGFGELTREQQLEVLNNE